MERDVRKRTIRETFKPEIAVVGECSVRHLHDAAEIRDALCAAQNHVVSVRAHDVQRAAVFDLDARPLAELDHRIRRERERHAAWNIDIAQNKMGCIGAPGSIRLQSTAFDCYRL